jgi:hypothetical protein
MPEHRPLILPSVVSEGIFVEVELKILMAHRPINTLYAVLHQAPETFNRVGVDKPLDVNLRLMMNPLVDVAL